MRGALLLLVLLFFGAVGVAQSEEVVSYVGNGMAFEYPVGWAIDETNVGAVLYDNSSVCTMAITMHSEGCYLLEEHPILLDALLKLYGPRMWGTPAGDPISGSYMTDFGPHSYATQIYEDPLQSLTCEIQGFNESNVTVTFNLAIWDQDDPNLSRSMTQLANLFKSFQLIPELEAGG